MPASSTDPPEPAAAGGPARIDGSKLAAARVFATAAYPYLASAVFASPAVAAPGSATVAVDREWRIVADPDVVDSLDAPELGRLLVHLVSHLLRDHAGRVVGVGVAPGAGGGGATRWNRAADAEINDDLAADGMAPSCAGDVPAVFAADAGRLAEQYYPAVPPGPRPWDCGSGCDSVPRPWDQVDREGRPEGIAPRRAGWLRLTVASEMQRLERLDPGTVGAGWLRWAEGILPSKVDWRRLIAAEIRGAVTRSAGMVDYSYRRPSRRAAAVPEIVLPTLDRPVPDVAVVCDTSGSMGEGELARVLAEVEAILRRSGLPDNRLRVLSCDAEVHAVRRVSRATQVQLLGGGGTDMGEGIRQAAGLRPKPDVIVVLTDGWTPWPEEPPRATRVIAGIIGPDSRFARHGSFAGPAAPPRWIRSVPIDR